MSPRPLPVRALADGLAASLERMIRIQMEAAPAHWSEADKRDWAEARLLGRGPAR